MGMGSQGTNLSRAARHSGSRVSACSFIKDGVVSDHATGARCLGNNTEEFLSGISS